MSGWCFSTGIPIAALELRAGGLLAPAHQRFEPVWHASGDVAAAYGPAASRCRFNALIPLGGSARSFCGGTLAAVLQNGTVEPVAKLGTPKHSPAGALTGQFLDAVRSLAQPRILEVGSRARSGVTRRNLLPAEAEYTGCDIVAGENVDLVCDAHALSQALPLGHYNAVMSFSVLEHLSMPWKFVIELNKVLALGAVGLFTTHQCWPIHDAPWDFWRFSDRAWPGLLNPATGFEIIAAAMGEPAHIVALDCHPVTNFVREPAGFLASNVLFRKIGETTLTWDVDPAGLAAGRYPG